MEYQVEIGTRKILIEKNKNDLLINGETPKYRIEKHGDEYIVFTEAKVTTVRILTKNGNSLTMQVNGKTVEVNVKDHIALTLENLGIDNAIETVINKVIAPMPGVIMSILVEESQEIKKGDPLLILEAMKMENMIKSPRDGIVTFITIEKGQSVEKNETLMSFS